MDSKIDLTEIFKFLGGSISPHPSSRNQSSPELYKEWQFPEPYQHLNHPTWKNIHLEEDWNFIHLVIDKIESLDMKENFYKWTDEEGIHYNFDGFSVEIENGNCWIYARLSLDPILTINVKTAHSGIKGKIACIQSINEFINWYNKQNK